jgi:hypothetical protein
MRFRSGLVAMAGVAAMLLAGCAVTADPSARGVDAWSNGTSWDEDGKAVTTKAQAEQDLVGLWILADNADRDCKIELRVDGASNASMHKAMPTNDCMSVMQHVAGWNLAEGKIVLFDKNSRQIGSFEAAKRYRYQGEFTISTGASLPATFVRGA